LKNSARKRRATECCGSSADEHLASSDIHHSLGYPTTLYKRLSIR
jgi:hypothetical protein